MLGHKTLTTKIVASMLRSPWLNGSIIRGTRTAPAKKPSSEEPQLEVRGSSAHDLEDVVALCDEAFHYKRYPTGLNGFFGHCEPSHHHHGTASSHLSSSKKNFISLFRVVNSFSAAVRADPNWKPERTRVAILHPHKHIISAVRICERELRVGTGESIPVAGLANLATKQEYRASGIASSVLADALKICEKELGCNLAMIFAEGPSSHMLLERMGFSAKNRVERQFSLMGTANRSLNNILPPPFPVDLELEYDDDKASRMYNILEMDPDRDVAHIHRIFSDFQEFKSGTVVRSPEYEAGTLRWKYDKEGFLIAQPVMQAQRNPVAYVRGTFHEESKIAHLYEFGHEDGQALASVVLLRHFIRLAKAKGCEEINIHNLQFPLLESALVHEHCQQTLADEDNSMMLRLLGHPSQFVHQLQPILERRIEEYNEKNPRNQFFSNVAEIKEPCFDFVIECGGDDVLVHIHRHYLTVKVEKLPDAPDKESTFLRRLRAADGVSIIPRVRLGVPSLIEFMIGRGEEVVDRLAVTGSLRIAMESICSQNDLAWSHIDDF